MRKIWSPLKNEDGYFLILATLMILVLLTILGIAASRTANTEISVAANDMVYQRNFYLAEGAVMEAVDYLKQASDLDGDPPIWFNKNPAEMKDENAETYLDGEQAGISALDDTSNTRYVAGLEAIARGYSLDLEKVSAHAIGIYGRCEKNGKTMIKVGYLALY
jgi:Tfp pilus assembly protein PilX